MLETDKLAVKETVTTYTIIKVDTLRFSQQLNPVRFGAGNKSITIWVSPIMYGNFNNY